VATPVRVNKGYHSEEVRLQLNSKEIRNKFRSALLDNSNFIPGRDKGFITGSRLLCSRNKWNSMVIKCNNEQEEK
jgi:hypothetical protein